MSLAVLARANRHASRQAVSTPQDFLGAVEHRFGEIRWDLAATRDNSACREAYPFNYFGPDHDFVHWHDTLILPVGADAVRAMAEAAHAEKDGRRGVAWLNPPFKCIAPWAKWCGDVCERWAGITITMLVPASIGAAWFERYVWPRADVLVLAPRLVFTGETQPFPKDLMLCVFGAQRFHPAEREVSESCERLTFWRWRGDKRKAVRP